MKIAFICTGNTCRSPMAEALLKAHLSKGGFKDTTVLSRGLKAAVGAPASKNAVTVMNERGIDISSHRSAPLLEDELSCIDLFVCMGYEHAAALDLCGVESEKLVILNIPDPYGGSLDEYRAVADMINSELESIYEYIK